MKSELLDALVTAHRARQAAVLVRGLKSGRQFLVTSRKSDPNLKDVDPDLRDAAIAALDRDGAYVLNVDDERYLLQTLTAPPRMLVVGAVQIAQSLIPMAARAGFDVFLIDPRTAFATPDRFPEISIDHRWPDQAMSDFRIDARTAIVTLSHDPKIDDPALCAALTSDAFYIGSLGSKSTHAKRLERLAALGYSPEALRRIHGPIGLPLGGRSPAEIAVAILAQVIQSRYRLTRA